LARGEATQLRVLLPEVGFDEFGGSEELQNGEIARSSNDLRRAQHGVA
jgi:hypothetical protein